MTTREQEYKKALAKALPHIQTQNVVDLLELEQDILKDGTKEALLATGKKGTVLRAKLVGKMEMLEELLVLATTPINTNQSED